jgi:hypothetical protein
MINKYVDLFLIRDFFQALISREGNYKIGWVVPRASPYKRVMASTRIRVYDIINFINSYSTDLCSSLYRKYSHYDVVVFQKAFSKRYQDIATSLMEKGIKVVFDINVNYVSKNITRNSTVTNQQTKDVKRMVSLVDCVIVSTRYLYDIYKKYNSNIVLIEESIPASFFRYSKEHTDNDVLKLVYCGYSAKALEIKPIADILKEKYAKKVDLITICDKDPELDFIKYKYVWYDYAKLPEILLKGDICIAPRDITVEYNLAHAFTKIGYPMSVGLCVLASPVPSYRNSPAILCEDLDDWRNKLNDLITSIDERMSLAKLGREYCLENYSMDIIGKKYIECFNNLIQSR